MPVTLQNPNKVAMPSWLSDASAGNSLADVQSRLPGMYDTSALRNAATDYSNSFANRAEMGFDAQARAAQTRAMLSGGRVGASFTKGGLILGLQNNLNALGLDYAKLAAQMQAQRAGQEGQLAGQIANYGLGRQNLMADWTRGQQVMGLQAKQFNASNALDRNQFNHNALMDYLGLAGNDLFQDEDERNLARAAAMPRGRIGDFGGPTFQSLGYVGNSGPVTGATVNGVYQGNQTYDPSAAVALGGGLGQPGTGVPHNFGPYPSTPALYNYEGGRGSGGGSSGAFGKRGNNPLSAAGKKYL